MEHPHQTKIALFESLKAWLDDEIVAETWLDTYQVMRDDESLNDGLDYLLTALTYDNETVQLNESLSKELYGSTLTQVFLDLKAIKLVHLNTLHHMVYV